jgi:Zn-finger nucleic acid-binding protein
MGRVNCPLCRAVQIDENYQNNNENYQNNNENYQNNNENYQNNNENYQNNNENYQNNIQNNLYIENLLPNWMDIIDYNYILQDMNNTIHTNNVENILVVN